MITCPFFWAGAGGASVLNYPHCEKTLHDFDRDVRASGFHTPRDGGGGAGG